MRKMIKYDFKIDDMVHFRNEIIGKFHFTDKLINKYYKVEKIVCRDERTEHKIDMSVEEDIERLLGLSKRFEKLDKFLYDYNIMVNGETFYPSYFYNISDERRKKLKRILNELN